MNIFKRVIRIISYVFLTFCLVALIFCGVSSDRLDIVSYEINSDEANFSCLVISDYHHRSLNFANGNMIDILEAQDPVDYVFFTGDLIDSHTKSLDDATKIFNTANNIATKGCYFVTGNHEEYAPLWGDLQTLIDSAYLKNGYVDDGDINIYGLEDARFEAGGGASFSKREEIIKKNLNNMISEHPIVDNEFNVLLVHRPENFKMIARDYNFDLVISGHTHGGQFRIGDWVPSSIFLEEGEFMGGKYHRNNTDLIISRGLGYSAMFPLRVNCNPEITKITIK